MLLQLLRNESVYYSSQQEILNNARSGLGLIEASDLFVHSFGLLCGEERLLPAITWNESMQVESSAAR